MVTRLAEVLQYLYPALVLSPTSAVQFVNQMEGAGPVIVRWDAALGVQPTQTALETTEASAGFQAFLVARAATQAADAAVKPDLRAAAAQAIADLDTYLALANPTNAQNQAALRLLCQTQKRIIRRLVQVD